MVAEDATTMEEAQAAVSAENARVSVENVKVLAVSVEEVQVVSVEDLKAAALAEEAKAEAVRQRRDAKADSHLTALQDAPEVLMLQEKEDQEEANTYC